MFREWDNFYLLIGSAAAALIGLLFVVATLTSGREQTTASRGVKLFLTPTVFHFAVVLVISAVTMAPGLRESAVGVFVGAWALVGLVYTTPIAVTLHRGNPPEIPHWSDFWCYGAAPVALYLCLAATAATITAALPLAAYALAGFLLALLLIGIRNAWDLVTWLAPRRQGP
ncbi:MAG: hypothetical protein NVSMB26_17420 [Beijerinckiaceae bacterium]